MGKWQVYDRDGTQASSKVTIVRAADKWIMYRRKDRADPKGTLVRNGTVEDWGFGVYRVAIGNFQYIEAEEELSYECQVERNMSEFAHARERRRRRHARHARRLECARLAQERRMAMAARRIQRFLRDTTCNPVYAAARRSLDRLYQS